MSGDIYTPEEQAEHRALWVEALRSGKYKQTMNFLRDKDGFCCLGVACEVAVAQGVIEPPVPKENGLNPGFLRQKEVLTYEGGHQELGPKVLNWLGLVGRSGDLVERIEYTITDGEGDDYSDAVRTLAELNDEAGYSFTQIADVIEQGKVQTNA